MTPPDAEITFVVDRESPPSPRPEPRFVCALCRSDIQHNLILRLSFCPIHGFASDLAEIRTTGYARTRGCPG
jgi:hypothetical protein